MSGQRLAAAVVLMVGLCGCATLQATRARSLCAHTDERHWNRLAKPPDTAQALRRLADAKPYAGMDGPREHERWFSLPTGELMLCRTDRLTSAPCSGVWWQFKDAGADPQVADQGGWICVD